LQAAAAHYHKLEKEDPKKKEDPKTFVDRQLKKDASVVAEAFKNQFKTDQPGFDATKIDPKVLDKFIDENFVPIDEAGVLEELVFFF
jgi:hypothetical protein